MKKIFVVLIAFGAFWLPGVVRRGTAQDSLQYILMIVNQGTQITNQGLALARMDTHIGQLTGQFEHLKESALGQIGAITDPIADLIAVPTDLLNTARDWHSDFTGQASSLIDAMTELDDGTSLSESWRDVLQEADTVTAADIRDIYQSNSNAADAAVATFERQRDHADRSVVLAHARADAAASLAATAAEVQDKIDTVAGENNVSDTALQQAILAGNLSQGQLLAAMAQMEAWDASAAAAEAYNAEVVRRELEARRLAERAALEALWAQEQATLALGADARIELHVWRLSVASGLWRELKTMMNKRVITWTLVVALAAAVPAFGIFGIPSPDELLIWFVLRPMMHGNQRTMIANQLLELQKLVEQLQTAQSQLTQVRNAAQGLVGAIADPMADLVTAPTDWLNTGRDWHSNFTGQAGEYGRVHPRPRRQRRVL